MRFSLRSRIYLGILPLLILFLGLMCYVTLHVRDIFQESKELAWTNVDTIKQLKSLRQELNTINLLTTRPDSFSSNSNELARVRESAVEIRGISNRLDAELLDRKLPGSVIDPKEFIGQLADLASGAESLSIGLQDSLAVNVVSSALIQKTDTLLNAADRYLELLRERLAWHAELVYSVLVGGMVFAILLTLVISTLLWQRIVRPIEVLHKAVQRAGPMRRSIEIDYKEDDELGELARSVEGMASRLASYQQLTNERLVRSTSAMRSILDQSPDAFFIFSEDFSPTYLSPSASRLYRNSNLSNGLPPEVEEHFKKTFETATPQRAKDLKDAIRLKVGDSEKWYLVHTFPFDAPDSESFSYEQSGDQHSIAAIFQEATVLKLSDSLRKNLLATVSHELKTPITSARMGLYLLLDGNVGPLNDIQKELVVTARDDVNRQLATIEHLLDLSRMEEQINAFDYTKIAIDALVDESMTAHLDLARASSVEIEYAPLGADATAYGDREKLRIVINNFLVNAIKYGPSESKVYIRADVSEERFRLEVEDEGQGIEQEFVSKVFDAYARGRNTKTIEGSGLGLKISKDMVEAHGGTIGCYNQKEKGAVFFFEIPTKRY